MRVRVRSPLGEPLELEDAPSPADPDLARDPAEVARRVAGEGFAVVRGVIPAALRAALLASIEAVVRPCAAPLPRVKPPSPAPHPPHPEGRLVSALRSVHRLEVPALAPFGEAVQAILAHPPLRGQAEALLGGASEVFESFFFEVNNATEPHRDTDYCPGVRPIGAWIALVDVPAAAGRFYLYAGSHLGARTDAREAQGPDYGRRLLAEAAARGLRLAAPALAAGDVVFFEASLIHGSLPTDGAPVRPALTAHFVRATPAG